MRRATVQVMGFLMLLVVLSGCGALDLVSGQEDGGPTDTCPDCTAIKAIIGEYDANWLRAEARYQGERHDLSGKITAFDKSRRGEPIVTLDVGITLRDRNIWSQEDIEYPLPVTMTFASWGNWLYETNTGDRLEANCLIKQFRIKSSIDNKQYGVPELTECRKVATPSSLEVPYVVPGSAPPSPLP